MECMLLLFSDGGFTLKEYIIRRVLISIPILIGTSFLIFYLFALLPGDYVDSNPSLTPQRAAELREFYGFNEPVIKRYFNWIAGIFHSDLGFSFQYQQPVTKVINQFIWNSFIVSIISLVITWIIALITGVYSAMKQYSIFDSFVTFFVFAAMSIPSFFIGLLLIKIFAIDMNLLPVGGMIDVGSNTTGLAHYVEIGRHMILPVFILVLLGTGSLTRYVRTSMLEVVRQDYIRTARAKGLKESKIIFKHALKNALLPCITLLAFELPALFSGAIIIEQVFNWPGIGQVQLESLNNRDYPVLMTFTMFLSFLTILGNLFADVAYAAVDPRIRLK